MKKLILTVCLIAAAIGCLTSCSGLGNDKNIQYLPVQTEEYGKWSFVDPDGNILLPDEFKNQPSAVINGIFAVKEGDGYTLYSFDDKTPKAIKDCEGLVAAGVCHEDLIPITRPNCRISVIDSDGEEQFVLNPVKGKEITACAPGFMDGMLPIMTQDEKFGYVDTKGNVAIEPKYSMCFPFGDGLGLVGNNDNGERYMVVDKTGEVVFKLKEGFDPISQIYHDGRIFGRDANDNIVWIDREGQSNKCPAKVKTVGDYNDKYYVFRSEDYLYGLMNYDGEVMIRAKYERLSLLDNGKLLAGDNEKSLILTSDGEEKGCIENVNQAYNLDGFGILGKGKTLWQLYDMDGKEVRNAEFYAINPIATLGVVESDYFDAAGLADAVAEQIIDNGIGGLVLGTSAPTAINDEPSFANWYERSYEFDNITKEGYHWKTTLAGTFTDLIAPHYVDGYESGFNPDANLRTLEIKIETEAKACLSASRAIAEALTKKGYKQVAATGDKASTVLIVMKKGDTLIGIGNAGPHASHFSVEMIKDPAGDVLRQAKELIANMPSLGNESDSFSTDRYLDVDSVTLAPTEYYVDSVK